MPVAAMFVAVVLTNFSRSITSVCLYVVTDCVSKEGKKNPQLRAVFMALD